MTCCLSFITGSWHPWQCWLIVRLNAGSGQWAHLRSNFIPYSGTLGRAGQRAQHGNREVSSVQSVEKLDHLWQHSTHPPSYRISRRCQVETPRKIRLLSRLPGALLPSGGNGAVVQHWTAHNRKCPHISRYHHLFIVTMFIIANLF